MQIDEYRRRATPRPRPATVPAATAVPAGQIPAELTTAFLRFVTLLNERTEGAPELEIIVRQIGAPREIAGRVPVSEATAVAILAAVTGGAVQIRPLNAEPAPEHSRANELPDAGRTACAVHRLQCLLALSPDSPNPADGDHTRPRTVTGSAGLRLVTGEAQR